MPVVLRQIDHLNSATLPPQERLHVPEAKAGGPTFCSITMVVICWSSSKARNLGRLSLTPKAMSLTTVLT
ncbi:MAG: hypothetical protein ACJ788_00015 [Ktedonobacteraceae bacterium]